MSKRVGPGRAQAQQPAVRLARAIVKPQHPEQWAEGNLPAAFSCGLPVPRTCWGIGPRRRHQTSSWEESGLALRSSAGVT